MALNENRRPPFTTLAHRLTLMTRSRNSDFGASLERGWPPPRGRTVILLELQAAGARAVGERLHAPVIEIAAAIEADLLDTALLRALGEQLAHGRADRGLALALGARAEILAARCRGQRDPAHVVDDLRVDVTRAPEHRQARPLGRADHPLADAVAPDAAPFGMIVRAAHDDVVPAGFPALRRMYSASYLIPLPL